MRTRNKLNKKDTLRKFTLRMSLDLYDKIVKQIESRQIQPSMNSFVLEALFKFVE